MKPTELDPFWDFDESMDEIDCLKCGANRQIEVDASACPECGSKLIMYTYVSDGVKRDA